MQLEDDTGLSEILNLCALRDSLGQISSNFCLCHCLLLSHLLVWLYLVRCMLCMISYLPATCLRTHTQTHTHKMVFNSKYCWVPI